MPDVGITVCAKTKVWVYELKMVQDIAEGLMRADASAVAFRSFQRRHRAIGKPQLVKFVAAHLNRDPKYYGAVVTKRMPDLLIREIGLSSSRLRVASAITEGSRALVSQSSTSLCWKCEHDWGSCEACRFENAGTKSCNYWL